MCCDVMDFITLAQLISSKVLNVAGSFCCVQQLVVITSNAWYCSQAEFNACFFLIACLAYSLIMKMEAVYFLWNIGELLLDNMASYNHYRQSLITQVLEITLNSSLSSHVLTLTMLSPGVCTFLIFPEVKWDLSPLGTLDSILAIVPALDDRWWVWSSRNENWQQKPKYWEKTYSNATLSTTNPIEPCPLLWEAGD
jgi:hypothetical protein